MFCTKCGKEIRDGELYCTACGKQIGQSGACEKPESSNKKMNKKSWIIVVAVVLIGVIIYLGTGLFGNNFELKYEWGISSDEIANIVFVNGSLIDRYYCYDYLHEIDGLVDLHIKNDEVGFGFNDDDRLSSISYELDTEYSDKEIIEILKNNLGRKVYRRVNRDGGVVYWWWIDDTVIKYHEGYEEITYYDENKIIGAKDEVDTYAEVAAYFGK